MKDTTFDFSSIFYLLEYLTWHTTYYTEGQVILDKVSSWSNPWNHEPRVGW